MRLGTCGFEWVEWCHEGMKRRVRSTPESPGTGCLVRNPREYPATAECKVHGTKEGRAADLTRFRRLRGCGSNMQDKPIIRQTAEEEEEVGVDCVRFVTDRERRSHGDRRLCDFRVGRDGRHFQTDLGGVSGAEGVGKSCLKLKYEPWYAEMNGREIDPMGGYRGTRCFPPARRWRGYSARERREMPRLRSWESTVAEMVSSR